MKGINFILTVLFFAASAAITGWFITASPGMVATEKMGLSFYIAGGKWLVQLVAAWILLGDLTMIFWKRIGFACFVGSLVLLPHIILSQATLGSAAASFFWSLGGSVAVMTYLYYRAVTKTKLSIKWWLAWLTCLGIAISLQVAFVFR